MGDYLDYLAIVEGSHKKQGIKFVNKFQISAYTQGMKVKRYIVECSKSGTVWIFFTFWNSWEIYLAIVEESHKKQGIKFVNKFQFSAYTQVMKVKR